MGCATSSDDTAATPRRRIAEAKKKAEANRAERRTYLATTTDSGTDVKNESSSLRSSNLRGDLSAQTGSLKALPEYDVSIVEDWLADSTIGPDETAQQPPTDAHGDSAPLFDPPDSGTPECLPGAVP